MKFWWKLYFIGLAIGIFGLFLIYCDHYGTPQFIVKGEAHNVYLPVEKHIVEEKIVFKEVKSVDKTDVKSILDMANNMVVRNVN